MTKISDERLAKMLATLDRYDFDYDTMSNFDDGYYVRYDQVEELLTTLRAHNSDSAEPVAWRVSHGGGFTIWNSEQAARANADATRGTAEPLYLASPPEKEVERLREALLEIRELNTLPPDENGHRWDNSDLIAQTIMSALTNRTPDDEVGNG